MSYIMAKEVASCAMENFKQIVGDFVTHVEAGSYSLDDRKMQHEALMDVNHSLQRMQLAIGQYIDYANARINQDKMKKPIIN